MFGMKKLGCQPNPDDKRDLSIDVLGLSVLDTPDKSSLEDYIITILNQGNSSSCVGQAAANAIMILENEHGLPYDPASVLFMYFNSRKYHDSFITDSGTYIRALVKMWSKFGVCSDKFWSFSTNPLKLNRQPSWNAYMRSHYRKGVTYARIFDNGSSRLDGINAAIHAGFPVIFGTDVPKSFLADKGPEIVDRPGKTDKIAGGHAMLLVGYELIDGYLFYDTLNSWGPNWRNGGLVRLTQDFITWTNSRDFTIVKGWNSLRSKSSLN